MTLSRRKQLAVGLTAAALLIAGCSSASTTPTSASSPATASSPAPAGTTAAAMSPAAGTGSAIASGSGSASGDVLTQAKAVTAADFAGTDRALPATGPTAAKNKTVWAIACSTTAAGCNLPATGLMDAGKALGWNMKLIDGKLDPTVESAQIRAAGAAGASAVALFSVNCAENKAAIQAVQAQGTKVYGVNSLDCDDVFAGGGKALFDAAMVWGPDNVGYGPFVDKYVGPAVADWIISTTDGKANVIQLRQDDSAGTRHVGQAEFDQLAKCSGCTTEVVNFTGADLLGGGLQAKTSAALQKYPNATVVLTPTDATISLGTGAAVAQARAAGRKLILVGQEGVPSAIKAIKAGTQQFAVGRPWPWTGWAAADGLNRMFAGQKQVDSGIGFGSMDAAHLPTGTVYDGNAKSSGYQANYKRIWGVS